MELHIIRHAEPTPTLPTMDSPDRELTSRGREDAARLSDWLKAQGAHYDLILMSDQRRARETAAHLHNLADKTEISPLLNTNPPSDLLLKRVRSLPSRAAIVGHEPQLGELIAILLGVPGKGKCFPVEQCGIYALRMGEQPSIKFVFDPQLIRGGK